MKMKSSQVLMLLENNPFLKDTRARCEAETLRLAGYQVTVICPKLREQTDVRVNMGIQVYDFPVLQISNGKLGYLVEYGSFLFATILYTLYVYLHNGFDIIHAHNPPDFLLLIVLPWKLLGKKFIFDHHDLAPEMFAFRFGDSLSLLYRVLLQAEMLSCRLADLVLASNESIRNIEIERNGIDSEKIKVVRNGPELSFFSTSDIDQPANLSDKSCLLAYVGTIGPMDGVEYLLDAVAHIVHSLGRHDVFCRVIGDGDALPQMVCLAKSLDIADRVEFTGWIHDRQILGKLLSEADICIDPAPSNSLNDYLTMIKIMEYMARAKPIVAFDLPETRTSAQEAALYAEPNSFQDMAGKIMELIDDPDRRARMSSRGRMRVISELAWEHSAERLIEAYNELR